MKGTRKGWKSWSAIVVGFVAVTLGGFFNKGWSEDLPPPTATVATAGDTGSTGDIDQRLKVLERKQEIADEAAAEKAKSGFSTKVQPGEGGIVITSADGSFKTKIGGYVQFDGRFYNNDRATPNQAPNNFLLRRVRPVLDSSYGDFALRLVPDFGGGTTVLQDAYGEYKPVPYIGTRIGKFKTPIDIERLQSDVNYLFVETALTSALTPNRDIGAQLQGDIGSGVAVYAAGVYDGVTDGGIQDTDTNSNKDVAARIFVQPFKNTTVFPAQGLGLGVASSWGRELGNLGVAATGSQLPSFKTDGQQTFFSYAATAYARGEHFRIVPQLYYHWNSLGVLGEYVSSRQAAQISATNKKTFTNKAYQGAVTYVLTGEDATLNGVTPAKPFDPKNHQWGAVELAARYAQLNVDPNVFVSGYSSLATSASIARTWTGGVSWYLTKSVRTILDYSVTQFNSGAAKNQDRENENVILSRIQFVF